MAHDELDNQLDPLEGDMEDPRGGPTWVITVAGAVLFFVTCVAVAGLYYGAERIEERTKYISVSSEARETRRIAWEDRLMQKAHWETHTDASGDMVIERKLKLPIDQAMEIVVERYAKADDPSTVVSHPDHTSHPHIDHASHTQVESSHDHSPMTTEAMPQP